MDLEHLKMDLEHLKMDLEHYEMDWSIPFGGRWVNIPSLQQSIPNPQHPSKSLYIKPGPRATFTV